MRVIRLPVVLALALVLAAPALAAPKKPKPHPPPPPPDTADDCTFSVEPSVPDYLVLATINVAVRCATAKQTITVSADFTRDGVAVPLIPYDTLTCTNTNACGLGIDLFSYDNHPVAFPGDQVYCAGGSGLVGGRVLGPASACEIDPRI